MICIDNEGAKFALIRGYSDSYAISLIRHLVALQLDDFCVLPWYSRVPYASNCLITLLEGSNTVS